MRLGQRKNLARLLKPSEIAFIGGADAEIAINEAKRRGFSGSIWPVSYTHLTLPTTPYV